MNALTEVNSSREYIRITEEVKLVILKDENFEDAGVLRFESGEEIEFKYDDNARKVFDDLASASASNLLAILARGANQL